MRTGGGGGGAEKKKKEREKTGRNIILRVKI
jgi:hypothetical protein